MSTKQLIQLLDFNYAPAVYIDASWLESLEYGDVANVLSTSQAAQPWLSKFILRTFNLVDETDFNFEKPIKQIALMDRSQLAKTIYHAGLSLNSGMIRGIVKRQERSAIESCIGTDAFMFAVKKAPYIAGALPDIFPCTFQIDWNNPNEMKKHLFRSGMKLLGIVLGSEPECYKRRLLFKFPIASKEYFGAGLAEQNNDEVIRQGGIMLKKLMKEFSK
ncbi:MAG: SctK family type III secretion system sorting platform protein [Endozoicomonadaceae bacterium]|nr:SctK family type III secretion system sorting platform protein [Endozoicomonadaceae bacterium]